MKKPDPSRLTATEAAEAIAAGTLTSVALTEACLARIETRDAAVQAWAHLDPEFALLQARAADRAQASGATLGVLHGVPVGVKDIIDVAGLGGEHGSAIFAGRMPEHDAVCVAALRSAGAIILGKTVTTELANRTANGTRNPHDPARTPGGSSSGSAAGVADRQMPLALGTQTAGSVIRPASYCGVWAIKPTLGLIPRRGALLQSHTLDTIGVYGRSVDDLALGLDAIAIPDPDDPVSFPRARGGYLQRLRVKPDRKLRLAFIRSPVWKEGDDPMRKALKAFAKTLGDACVRVDLSAAFERASSYHATVMGAEAAHFYGGLLDAHPDKLSGALKDRLKAGRTVKAHDYIAAIEAREGLYAEIAQVLDGVDAILTPSAPGIAPADLQFTGDPAFNSIWTYLGVPCVNLPLLESEGMPLGVQLIGKRREDGRLLRTARALDAMAAAGGNLASAAGKMASAGRKSAAAAR